VIVRAVDATILSKEDLGFFDGSTNDANNEVTLVLNYSFVCELRVVELDCKFGFIFAFSDLLDHGEVVTPADVVFVFI
jgi:hypothetical protein